MTRRHGGAGLPEGTIDLTFRGIGRAELRRLRPPGRHHAPVRRHQRLPGQGPVRGAGHRASGRGRPLRRRGEHRGRQRDPLRGHRRRGLPPRPGRRAVLRPQLGGHRRGRGRGRPRLRVHDRRPGGGARADRAQLRGRHVGRRGLRLRSARRAGRDVQPEMVDLEPLRPDDRMWLRDRITMHRDETGSAVAERLLADWVSSPSSS